MSLARPTLLVIHDDGEALDVLTRLFEASGFEVATAVTGFRAQAHLEGTRAVELVVAAWEPGRTIGGEVYRWALQRRYDLRDGFVFLASEPPPEFDRLVGGRCLAIAPTRPAELLRVAHAAVARRRQLEAARTVTLDDGASDRPTLLLADDEPALLMAMSDLLTEAGYAVARVDSGHGAILLLEHEEFDAIVADWNMDDGSGADVFRWVTLYKPWLAERMVFLSDEEAEDASVVAPGRPMLRKGQDARVLGDILRDIVQRAQGTPIEF